MKGQAGAVRFGVALQSRRLLHERTETTDAAAEGDTQGGPSRKSGGFPREIR